MKLELLKPAKGSVKANDRVGRGHGSGGGGTAKRGHKGAKSRSGYSQKRGFEGGQMPLQRRVPKFGFKNINRVEYKAINLDTIQNLFDKTGLTNIDLGVMYSNGLISKSDLVKVLGRGELKASVNLRANAFSESAVSAIEKAGGSATVDATFEAAGKIASVPKEVAPKSVKTPKAKVASIAPKTEKSTAVASETKSVEVAVEKAVAPVAETAKEIAAVVTETIAPVAEVEATPVVEQSASIADVTVKEEKTVSKAKKGSGSDDLKLIEGIGPKIAELLINAGIVTFADLAATPTEKVSEILAAAGPRFTMHNPATWAAQAELARDGKWDELKELQDRLNGGRAD